MTTDTARLVCEQCADDATAEIEFVNDRPDMLLCDDCLDAFFSSLEGEGFTLTPEDTRTIH